MNSGEGNPGDVARGASDHDRLLGAEVAEDTEWLRRELDYHRLEVQRLRAELCGRKDARHLLRTAATAGLATIMRTGREGRAALMSRPPSTNFHPTYQPYRIRIPTSVGPSPPRVLHAIANVATGGSTRLVADLLEGLGHRFHQEVVTRDAPISSGYLGMTIHRQRHARGLEPFLSLLRNFQPDLLHVHYFGDRRGWSNDSDWCWYHYLFQAAEVHGCKVIENVNIPVEPYVSRAVRCYVYVSQDVRHRFGRADTATLVIYPGSDLARFTRRTGTPVPDNCVGMVYRLDGDKVDDRSFEPILGILRGRRATKALVVGGGAYLPSYQAAAEAAGLAARVTLTGYVSYSDLPAMYEEMSLFVAPVHRESFGQVGVFAMSMGLPVVGYDLPALREILGGAETLVPPGDAHRLAELAIDLLDDPGRRQVIGERNRRRAHQLFSLDEMLARYEALYDQLIGSRTPLPAQSQ